MPIDKELYLHKFTKEDLPHWKCPRCMTGFLILSETRKEEEANSKDARSKRNWKEWKAKFRFNSFLTCSKSECKEVVAMSGNISYEKETKNRSYVEYLEPLYFNPNLIFFKLPYDCSYETEMEILKSFSLFWIDNASCANKIRNAVEYILTDKGIRLYPKGQRKKKLNLHQRIEIFRAGNEEVADTLMAIKWIGNAGTHLEEPDRDDILLGFELLENALLKLYCKEAKKLMEAQKRILKRKKPDSC